jgi:hypothetical protein
VVSEVLEGNGGVGDWVMWPEEASEFGCEQLNAVVPDGVAKR